MANVSINRGGINSGPINGPPSVYVDGTCTMPNGHSLIADGEVNQLYWNSSASLNHSHTFGGDAQSKVFGKGGINTRPINDGQINGQYGLYASAAASMVHSHTLEGDLTFGSDIVVFAGAEMSHGHTLQGDLTFFYSTIVYGESVMSHGHTLAGDLTFAYELYVNGTASMPHGHSLQGDGQLVKLAAAALSHSHSLSGDLTLGFETYIYASASLGHGHTLEGDLFLYDPVDGSCVLLVPHTMSGDLTLLPYIDGAATLTHDHDLEWTDTQTVLVSATMTHGHVIYGSALGGTPQIDSDPLAYGFDPVLDIEGRSTTNRKNQYLGVNYQVDGFVSPDGVNVCPLDTAPLNQNCGTTAPPDLSWELGLYYGVGETRGSLDIKYSYMFDVDDASGEIDMEYDLDVGTQSLVQGSIDLGWSLWGKTELEDLLDLVNTERVALGLVPYTLYTGVGEDVATTHSENMADTGIFQHSDPGLPVGYQTEAERITHIEEGPSGYGENLAGTATTGRAFADAATLFTAWWNSPQHKANLLLDWRAEDTPQMLLGYGFIYDWSGAPGLWTNFYTQLFIGYGIPAGATLAEGQIDIQYQVDTSLISELNIGYALDAYTPVTEQVETPYGINVSTQHELQYGARVSAQHEAPIHFSIVVQHEADWTQSEPVIAQHEADYDMDLYTRVLQSIATLWDVSLGMQHDSVYSLSVGLMAQHEAPYEPSTRVIAQNEAGYGINTSDRVTGQHTAYWALYDQSVTVTTSYATITLKR